MPDGHDVETRIGGVFPKHLERLLTLLKERLPTVIKANRYFEETTGMENKVGLTNLADTLSHIGTLAEEAGALSDDEQRDQVTNVEEHLRRSMMEAYEQVTKMRLGSLKKLWDRHQQLAAPLIAEGKLTGIQDVERLQGLELKIANLLNDGRDHKRKATWEEWENGTDMLREACETTHELADGLQQNLSVAERCLEDRKNRNLAIGLAIGGVVVGWLLGKVL